MHLFITGATGFIGSHVVSQALERGHQVTALRRSVGSSSRISSGLGVNWIECAMDALKPSHFVGMDAVLHLAAHTPNVPYDTLENCLYWNVTAALRMARAASAEDVGRFVIAGTCFEYGASGERYDFIPADAPLEPTSTYPVSKAASWLAFRQFAIETRSAVSYRRIFQVYGEGESANRLWPSLREAARTGANFELTPAEQIRDFIPVECVARQLLDDCEADRANNTMLTRNLGTGNPMSLKKFAELWWGNWEAPGKLLIGAKPYREGEVMRYVPQL